MLRPARFPPDASKAVSYFMKPADPSNAPSPTPATRQTLERLLAERILVLDGAMGTMVHALEFSEADFRGRAVRRASKGSEELHRHPVITQPEAIETDPPAVSRGRRRHHRDQHVRRHERGDGRFRLRDHVRELNLAAVALARRAVDEMNLRTPERPRFVAGSIGPTNKQLSIAGNVNDPGHRGVTFDQMVDTYYEQVDALVEGGVDMLLAETAFDTLVLKACLFAIDKYFDDHGRAAAGDGLVHDLRRRPDALGPDGRGLLEFDRACRPAERGHQLRAGARTSCGPTSKSCRGSRRST